MEILWLIALYRTEFLNVLSLVFDEVCNDEVVDGPRLPTRQACPFPSHFFSASSHFSFFHAHYFAYVENCRYSARRDGPRATAAEI